MYVASVTGKTLEQHRKSDDVNRDICPSLILADTILCDALERVHEPNNRQIRECCLNEYHVRCSLRRPL